jgi:hypothetical protein
VAGCAVWSSLDRKRQEYNRLHYWFSKVLVAGLSAILFSYGVVKIFPVQMAMPSIRTLDRNVGALSPFDLVWTTLGYGAPYQIFGGALEMTGALLILFSRTRPAGLLVVLSVILNIIALNYTYQIGVLVLSFYILLITLFLLAPYARSLTRLLFRGKVAIPHLETYYPRAGPLTTVFKTFLPVLIVTSFVLNTRVAYQLYTQRTAIAHSRRYYLIRQHIIDGDTLPLLENDSRRWRYWVVDTTGGKQRLNIVSMDPTISSTHTLEQDSAKHLLTLHPARPGDTTALQFRYSKIDESDWQLDGSYNKHRVEIKLKKIDPDTAFLLLKTKRKIIVFDDESE